MVVPRVVSTIFVDFMSVLNCFNHSVWGCLPRFILLVLKASSKLLRAGVSGSILARCPAHASLLRFMVVVHGSIAVKMYRCWFVIVFGHFICSIFLNCFLWKASILSWSVSVSAHSSLLYSIIGVIKAVNSLSLSVMEMYFELKRSLRFFMFSITRCFLLSMSSFVPSRLPSNLHFLQSGCGFAFSVGL